jgi:hypothetical protein
MFSKNMLFFPGETMGEVCLSSSVPPKIPLLPNFEQNTLFTATFYANS